LETKPAKIEPYYRSSRDFQPSDEAEQPKRQGPKVKTRPIANPLTPPSIAQEPTTSITVREKEEEEEAGTPPLPVFWVKKDVYDTFEKLFLGGKVKGTIDTWEFEKVNAHFFFLEWYLLRI